MKDLDSKDWKIMAELAYNARISHNQLAKKAKLTKNAVTYRIERLEKRGIITKYTILTNQLILGHSFYLLLKTNIIEDEEFIHYLQTNPNIVTSEEFSGEWNYIIEYAVKDAMEFTNIIQQLQDQFSGIIDTFEVHMILKPYGIRMLPIKQSHFLLPSKPATIDKVDIKLLHELSKKSNLKLYEIGEKIGLSYETVSARIKKLKKTGVIERFITMFDLSKLNYYTYLVILSLRNVNPEKEKMLVSMIKNNNQTLYSFMSASKPQLFFFLAVKEQGDLDIFLKKLKTKFSEIIVNQQYLSSTRMYKYDLFPEGLM